MMRGDTELKGGIGEMKERSRETWRSMGAPEVMARGENEETSPLPLLPPLGPRQHLLKSGKNSICQRGLLSWNWN